jgi:hypothetical protein
MHAVDVARSLISARRLLSVAGQLGDQLGALVWGDARLPLPSAPSATTGSTSPAAFASVDERRRAQVARIAGPVPAGAHPAPVSPARNDKSSAIAHYRAMAEQVARERRASGGAPHTPGRWM